ncbi:pyruvate synthase subunit beta [Candidatus Micrarchaeota archaeon]|nr:pyruvate synthase subunit beta [Candidatus Micrarchaeota archaeon]
MFLKGHGACSGCGSAIAIHMILRGLGDDAVVSLATGCMEVVSTGYPDNAWNVPVIHSLFENVPAVASGVSRALKKLGKKGVAVGIGGDGASYDIGFGALSGAMERNEDMIYICYDNEAYENTGIQRSGATPKYAATTTSPQEVGGKSEWKKNLSFIGAAHGIPYAATASIAYPADLQKKLQKARTIKGFKLITVFAGCQLGWRHDPSLSVEVARKAVASGMWNLYEIENGVFKRTFKPKQLEPVESYLTLQGRFKHLKPEQTAEIQEHVKKTQAELDKLEASGVNLSQLL